MNVQDMFYSGWIAVLLVNTWIYAVTSEEGCLSPLGMEDERIKDSQIRATSFRNGLSAPKYARLNHNNGQGGWCPNQTGYGNNTGPLHTQFIQVDLDASVRIKGIAIQGRAGGIEKVDSYWINYTPSKNPTSSEWIYDKNTGRVKYFKGNEDSELQKSILRPPIVADKIRLVPVIMVNKQVCMRFELLGCPFKSGLVNYSMPQGNARGGKYNFIDSIYDGLSKNNFLSSGLGFLTDGKLAHSDYVVDSGLGWIGWNAKETPAPYIIFDFQSTRIFHSMTIHCNVRDRTKIKLFSKVEVSFNVDDVAFDASLTYSPKDVSSGSLWLNYNVTINLCRHIGKKMKLNFTYAGEWILISEVIFNSVPLGSQPPPKVYCAPVLTPPLTTVPPSPSAILTTMTSPSEGKKDPGSSTYVAKMSELASSTTLTTMTSPSEGKKDPGSSTYVAKMSELASSTTLTTMTSPSEGKKDPGSSTYVAKMSELASSTTLTTMTSPSEGKKDPGSGGSTESKSMSGGVIAGIICAVVVVFLVALILFFWWHYPHWFFQREKPFNSFIKVEMQPYNHYQGSQRVSRVNSAASEWEEKRFSFRNRTHSGVGSAGAEVTACPIYSSIGENMDKESTSNGNVNNTRKCLHRNGSDLKPLKKVKSPVPPPLKPIQSVPEVIYAEPETPLLSASASTPSPGPSPKPPIPPRDSQIDFKGEFPDNDYAEPDTPVVKSPPAVLSPGKPNIVSGYAEPIDAISPTSLTTFPNPIYEEVYSEPYQGVSGTSLYCNPDDDLNMRSRQDSFKDFPRHKLHFKEKIGDGQFGEVHIGEAEGLSEIFEEYKNVKRVTVAIKTLKSDVDKNIKNDFFKEVKAMACLRHMNVIRLLGVCRDDPMCMIVEYMANGDLNQFLKEKELEPSSPICQSLREENVGQFISLHSLFYMAKQVAAGMKYISSLNYVHRDLATRNCLVGHAYTVKIADFGMSRNLYCKHYYRIEGRVILPIRWMAPESILQGRFTTLSDVWAFGVTLWEILTFAREYPYSDLTDEEVIKNTQASFLRSDTPFTVLPQPVTCPDDLYGLMTRCWSQEPENRPSFAELHSNLAERVRLSEANV